MAQGRDSGARFRIHAKLSQQFLIPHIIADGRTLPGFGIQQPLMVKRRQQAARIFQFPQPIQPHGLEPFEEIPIFPMLRRLAFLLYHTAPPPQKESGS